MDQDVGHSQKLISNLVLISFTCLWVLVLISFVLLIYQSVVHQSQIDDLIQSIEFFKRIEGN